MWLLVLRVAGNILTATVLPGLSKNDVIFTNHTGLPIARIEIGDRVLQGDIGVGTSINGRILVSVTPHVHNLRLVFRGGADVLWTRLNFKGVHEITFFRDANKIEARVQ